jgi:hypothetical protein
MKSRSKACRSSYKNYAHKKQAVKRMLHGLFLFKADYSE